MKKTLLLVLTFSGLYVVSTDMFREYHFINSPKTWAEAQRFCREVYSDLATVDSQDENIRLLLAMQDPGKLAWIGISNSTKRWKWTMAGDNFDGESGFFQWESKEPDNKDGEENCVVMNWIGFWRDEVCETERPFLCYDEQGPSKYILVNTFLTWDLAKNYCRSKYTDLVWVRNKSENEAIHPLLSRNVWIGLRRYLWFNWSDQSPVNFTNWNGGLSENNASKVASCAAADTATGKWLDVGCDTELEFICENLKNTQRRFKMQFQSEADLNDPAIQQQILDQLNTHLETDGLTDFKLHWIQTEGQTFQKEPKKKK